MTRFFLRGERVQREWFSWTHWIYLTDGVWTRFDLEGKCWGLRTHLFIFASSFFFIFYLRSKEKLRHEQYWCNAKLSQEGCIWCVATGLGGGVWGGWGSWSLSFLNGSGDCYKVRRNSEGWGVGVRNQTKSLKLHRYIFPTTPRMIIQRKENKKTFWPFILNDW